MAPFHWNYKLFYIAWVNYVLLECDVHWWILAHFNGNEFRVRLSISIILSRLCELARAYMCRDNLLNIVCD